MKRIAKYALSALMLAGAATALSTPADARVSVGIGIGIPGGYYGPAYAGGPAFCDRYSRYYNPYRCEDFYDSDGYYGPPVFFSGYWGSGSWHGGGWHGGGGHGGGGFHGGGHGGGHHH